MSLIGGFFVGLRPEPLLTVSQWADEHRYLSSAASAEPGRWRTDRTPYLREIQDRLSVMDPCAEIVVVKGAQLGFTEASYNWMGYIIDQAPGPTLMVMPTVDMSKRNSKMRFDPMIEATPRVRERIKPSRARDSGNTTFQKDFPGGTVILTGANSAAGLRSMPIRFLVLDEVDAYPLDLDGEGSPIDLAIARTRTFSRRKIYKISTPTIEGQSVIAKEFEATDQRYFFVPCPHCGGMQHLQFARLKWEKDMPETARYECEHCEELIEERYKTRMLADGQWQPTKPENETPVKAGYHINSLYSPYGWYSWAQAAKEWLEAQGDVPKLKTFVNTVLGETWKDIGEAPPWQMLHARAGGCQQGQPPKEVGFLTAGVDVQKDRLELEIVGWGVGKRSWSVDYRVLLGDTSGEDVWNELAKLLDEQWQREDGVLLGLRMMAVDTGYNTQKVYNFARRFPPTKVMAVKGQEALSVMVSSPKVVDVMINGRRIGGTKLWHVGVNGVKEELYGWLRLDQNSETLETPDGYCEFPKYNETYFRGLTAEKLVMTKNSRGFWKYEWMKEFERNEPMDCRVYARAAAHVLGIDRMTPESWAKLNTENTDGQKKATATVRKKKESYW